MQRFRQAVDTFQFPTITDLAHRVRDWFTVDAPTWAISAAVHTLILVVIALIPYSVAKVTQEGPAFEAVEAEEPPEAIERFEVGETPLDPTELNTETLMEWENQPVEQSAQYNDDSAVFEEAGGGTAAGSAEGSGLGFDIQGKGLGPALAGGGGVDSGLGTGTKAGRGGAGSGFGLRGSGNREAVAGVTKASERAVAAALNWLARHQNRDGSWSINHREAPGCEGGNCNGGGNTDCNSGATAMGLLPFLAAGQTQDSKGPYRKSIAAGLLYLIRNQKPDGDLSGGQHQMYAHGLATIALCEAYGMTQDSQVRNAAQGALNFIQTGQNAEGAWRYSHKSADSDTSVFGWQVMALKSGHMAGLEINPGVFDGCRAYLEKTGVGYHKGIFGYTPGAGATPAMTGVGLLTTQYLGAQKTDAKVKEGVDYIMANMPSAGNRSIYYWYYAAMAMHNVPGPEWDQFNRNVRRLLIESQEKEGCAAGSWNPEGDPWGDTGGRLMVTSLSALTLEVYYRYLPLYKLDRNDLDLKNPGAGK